MALKARYMALVTTLIILIILFSSTVSGQDIQGMAIVANKEKALGITIGPVTVAPGHVAFAYQNPLTGLFVFGSVGMDLSKATNLIDPTDLDINKEYTFDELKTLLANKGYTSYKAFYTNNPNFDAATNAEIDLTTANYNLFASTTKPITDPFSHAVGADDENCLTGTKKVLEAYGVDLPDWDESFSDTISVASLPNVWYLSLQGNTYYPDFMGDDPMISNGYGKSTSVKSKKQDQNNQYLQSNQPKDISTDQDAGVDHNNFPDVSQWLNTISSWASMQSDTYQNNPPSSSTSGWLVYVVIIILALVIGGSLIRKSLWDFIMNAVSGLVVIYLSI